jgi:predicted nucleic acid-binding Zn ribbon protein
MSDYVERDGIYSTMPIMFEGDGIYLNDSFKWTKHQQSQEKK